MSVNVTTMAPITNPPLSGGMRGVPPAIFDGTWSCADEFWSQFHWYKLVNHTHNSMVKPFNRVLTVLTYIRGPMINNWVNSQEQKLADWIDTTKQAWVHEDNEVLWQEFKTVFHDAWCYISDYFHTHHMQIIIGTAPFFLSGSLHEALTLILVLLHHNLCYHCTIWSGSSLSVRYNLLRVQLSLVDAHLPSYSLAYLVRYDDEYLNCTIRTLGP